MQHENSLAAYEKSKTNAAAVQKRVYEAIQCAEDGLTREEVETVTGISGNSVRPAVRRLIKQSHIIESGSRPTRSGNKAAVLRDNLFAAILKGESK